MEVFPDHASQDLSLLFVRVDIIISDFLDILDRITRVHLLTLKMVLDAAFGLADGAGTLAGYAAADLDGAEGV